MKDEKRPESLLTLLALMPAGRATIKVSGRPFLSVDSDKKTLEVEADGAKEVGFRLSEFVRVLEGPVSLLEGSERAIGELSRLGWKMTLYAGGEKMLAMGSGVSRLTGRVRVNPLKLRKLLKALR